MSKVNEQHENDFLGFSSGKRTADEYINFLQTCVGEEDADFDFFMSLKPNVEDYSNWCISINPFDIDFEYFKSLKPTAEEYYHWCLSVDSRDADLNYFKTLNPTADDYIKWCKDVLKKDANVDYFKSLINPDVCLYPCKDIDDYFDYCLTDRF